MTTSNFMGNFEPDEDLIQELRHQAKNGASVPELIDVIEGEIGKENAVMLCILYFILAFKMPITSAKELGNWSRFAEPAAYSDEGIQNCIRPFIQAYFEATGERTDIEF